MSLVFFSSTLYAVYKEGALFLHAPGDRACTPWGGKNAERATHTAAEEKEP